MHHDARHSYAILILLGGGSKIIVSGQLYVDPLVGLQQIQQFAVYARRLPKLYKRLFAGGD